MKLNKDTYLTHNKIYSSSLKLSLLEFSSVLDTNLVYKTDKYFVILQCDNQL